MCALVVHGVACRGHWAHIRIELERAFGQIGGGESLGCGGYCRGAGGGQGLQLDGGVSEEGSIYCGRHFCTHVWKEVWSGGVPVRQAALLVGLG